MSAMHCHAPFSQKNTQSSLMFNSFFLGVIAAGLLLSKHFQYTIYFFPYYAIKIFLHMPISTPSLTIAIFVLNMTSEILTWCLTQIEHPINKWPEIIIYLQKLCKYFLTNFQISFNLCNHWLSIHRFLTLVGISCSTGIKGIHLGHNDLHGRIVFLGKKVEKQI